MTKGTTKVRNDEEDEEDGDLACYKLIELRREQLELLRTKEKTSEDEKDATLDVKKS